MSRRPPINAHSSGGVETGSLAESAENFEAREVFAALRHLRGVVGDFVVVVQHTERCRAKRVMSFAGIAPEPRTLPALRVNSRCDTRSAVWLITDTTTFRR